MSKALAGKVCIVTGASRGIGKGVALQLGEAGATVYITGRTLKATGSVIGGSLEETADEIRKRGGKCIPIQCDHSNEDEITKLFEQVKKDEHGRLDLLINNAYAAVNHIIENFGKKFWEQPDGTWDIINNVGLRGHYLASVQAAKLMIPAQRGLIVNISSAGGLQYAINVPYGVGKEACDRMAADCALELKKHNIAFVSLWPGVVRTETVMNAILNGDNQRATKMFVDMSKTGESLEYTGQAIVHLAIDPCIMKKSGRILLTSDLGDEYGLCDIDGKKPANMRSLRCILSHAGWTKLSAFIPSFLKVPLWVLHCRSYKF